MCIGGASDPSFANIKTRITADGTNSSTILYRNLQSLKTALGIDAIDYDDESTYDSSSAINFGKMCGSVGMKVTLCPYTQSTYWKAVKSGLGSIVDYIYLQCYDGGAGNNPATWANSLAVSVSEIKPGYWDYERNATFLTNMVTWKNAGCTGSFLWPSCTGCNPPVDPVEMVQYADWIHGTYSPPGNGGGFESPVIGTGNYQYNPSGSVWAFSGASPNGSGILGDGSPFWKSHYMGWRSDGVYTKIWNFFAAHFRFVPGTNYTITFSAAQRPAPNQNGGESWKVTIDGTVIGSYNPGASATRWLHYTPTFTATASTHTLAFVGTDLAGGDNTVFIDTVRITPPLQITTPVVTTNTLPVTAADVVGSQVTFMAAFNGVGPLFYQWEMISGGVTNNITGATNTILTIASLQLTNTASYQLRASNIYGVAVSTPGLLTVSSFPAAVTNVITSFAAQTGLGSILTNFIPTWTVVPGSLIAGQSPSSVGSGSFSLNGAGTVAVLTDGSFGWLNYWPAVGSSTTEVTCGDVVGGAGQSITYTLNGSVTGYNLTNITVYGGWGDAGRDQQAYMVYYSTIAAPTTFIQLSSVNYNPTNSSGVQSATRVSLTAASGVLATNVAALKFDFTAPVPEHDYCGYSEINLYGYPTLVLPSTNPTNIMFQVGDGNLMLNWPGDHIGWRLQVQTNDLTQGLGTNWVDVPDSTATNQMFFPINLISGSVFYRLAY